MRDAVMPMTLREDRRALEDVASRLAVAMALVERQAKLLDILHHDNLGLRAQVEVLRDTLSGYVPALHRPPLLQTRRTTFKPHGTPLRICEQLSRGDWMTREQLAAALNRGVSSVADAMVQLRKNGVPLVAREVKDAHGRRTREFRMMSDVAERTN